LKTFTTRPRTAPRSPGTWSAMTDLNADLAVAMIDATSRRLDDAAPELSRLDAVAGDGDHGVNMVAAFRSARAVLATEQLAGAGDVFASVGRTFAAEAGGSAGALFGSIFGAIGGCLRRSDQPDTTNLADGLERAATQVSAIGRTRAGSKTMLDALLPAAEAARAEADAGGGIADVLTAAARASERGAAATADMRAASGRARHALDGAIGTMDPGAVTVSLMLGAWAEVAR
jgi:dihydroxyacetone kinase